MCDPPEVETVRGATAVFPEDTELKVCFFKFTRSKTVLTNSSIAFVPRVKFKWMHYV